MWFPFSGEEMKVFLLFYQSVFELTLKCPFISTLSIPLYVFTMIILNFGKFILDYFCPCYCFLICWLSVLLLSAFAKSQIVVPRCFFVLCLAIRWPHYFFAPILICCFLQLNFVICLFWVLSLFFLFLAVRGHFRHGGFFFSLSLCLTAYLCTGQCADSFLSAKKQLHWSESTACLPAPGWRRLNWRHCLELLSALGRQGDQEK